MRIRNYAAAGANRAGSGYEPTMGTDRSSEDGRGEPRAAQRPATVVAAIVVFNPDPAALQQLVQCIAPDVAAVVVFANSEIPPALETELQARAGATPLEVVRPARNVGLGAAYNAAAEVAAHYSGRHLLLLDQDSLPSHAMARRLVAMAQELTAAGERPAVVGPFPVTEAGEPFKIRRRARGAPAGLAAVPVAFAISSGSLVDVEALRDAGPFREDFFIDAIDIEWCLRAAARGWSVWIAQDVPMVHRLGHGVIALPFGLRLTDQPPHRFYTYLRNQIVMLSLAHVPLRRKARLAASLPAKCLIYLARYRFSGPIRRAVSAGLLHGAARKLSPPPAVWTWITSGGVKPPDEDK